MEARRRSSSTMPAATFSASSRLMPSSAPSSAKSMFLYSLEALSRLCSMTARFSTVKPLGSSAFWCGARRAAKASISGCVRMRSRYTLRSSEYTSSAAQRSSLYSIARMRDRCGPAPARMAHVAAALSACSRSSAATRAAAPLLTATCDSSGASSPGCARSTRCTAAPARRPAGGRPRKRTAPHPAARVSVPPLANRAPATHLVVGLVEEGGGLAQEGLRADGVVVLEVQHGDVHALAQLVVGRVRAARPRVQVDPRQRRRRLGRERPEASSALELSGAAAIAAHARTLEGVELGEALAQQGDLLLEGDDARLQRLEHPLRQRRARRAGGVLLQQLHVLQELRQRLEELPRHHQRHVLAQPCARRPRA
eukprot:scaffold7881_cov363-Prasinococcus_capsulatus_cf.AAC.1